VRRAAKGSQRSITDIRLAPLRSSITKSGLAVALLAALAILGSCGRASAGYLPENLDGAASSSADDAGMAMSDDGLAGSTDGRRISNNPFGSTNEYGSIFGSRNVLTLFCGLFSGRGTSPRGGAGAPSSQDSGTGGTLIGSSRVMVRPGESVERLLAEDGAGPPTSQAEFLFRPPR
jgi:hypothetical protein